MHCESFPTGPLGCTCSIVMDEGSRDAIVIDPGGDLETIRGRLAALGARVHAIVHTHTHIDHVGATKGVQDTTGAQACIHEADRFLYDLLPVQAALLGLDVPPKADMTGSLVDGCSFRFGSLEMCIMHTPGHTPGSVTFVVPAADQTRVFTGDTLFRGGIGRTDLWGGDVAELQRSLRDRLFSLPEDATVIPGHGPETTIGNERRTNPFVRRWGL